MNKQLSLISLIVALLVGVIFFPENVIGLLITTALSVGVVYTISQNVRDLKTQSFLIRLFIAAILVRVGLAIIIFGLDLQDKFGPDALYYDFIGKIASDYWWGLTPSADLNVSANGWGMPYIVGIIYFLTGQNPLTVQLIVCVLGAITVILAYYCSQEIFQNTRVARYTAIFIAFFPSMVIWTSQGLKDGFIIFFLVLALLSALYLQKGFNYFWVLSLLISLLAISSLRFYIFFMLTAAIAGGFVLSVRSSSKSLLTRFAICAVIGLAFSSLGVLDVSEQQADKYVSFARLQSSRDWASKAADSGIKDTTDVSTASGALSALPLGLLTLYLAPFPWQIGNITQGLTMPEMIIWWCGLPFLFSGIVYSIRHRLRESISVLFFVLILSLSYAVYQGNVGTLYRQRAQIQVFLLFFIAAGFTLTLEKMESGKVKRRAPNFPIRFPQARYCPNWLRRWFY